MTITLKTIGSLARRGSAMLQHASRGIQLPPVPPRARAFSGLQAPPRPATRFAGWKMLTNADSVKFQSALNALRQNGDSFQATLADVEAAENLLWAAHGENDRLQRSTTYDGLRHDLRDALSMPAGDAGRQQKIQELFREQVALMDSHAPSLLQPLQAWQSVISSEEQATFTTEPVPICATFTLGNGEAVSLRPVQATDPQALAAFLNGLPDASYQARFPKWGKSRDELACYTILKAGHPDPSLRSPSLVLQDGQGRIVGLVDYHERDKTLMRTPVEYAEAQGLKSPGRNLKTCEVDVVIADSLRGQRLGPRLLESAMKEAREAGYEQVVAVVADTNTSMLGGLRKMGASAGVPVLEPGYQLYVLA